MLNPEDFIRLGRHLGRLDPIIHDFCIEYNFVIDDKSLGRYPRRRIKKHQEINLFYDLQMDEDSNNRFYEKFFEEIPYSLAAGGWIDIDTMRYGKVILLFEGKPFNSVEKELGSILRIGFREIGIWSTDYLKHCGEISTVGP